MSTPNQCMHAMQPTQRPRAPRALAVLGVVVLTGCLDTPQQPTVSGTITGLRAAVTLPATRDSFGIQLLFPRRDSDAAVTDGGSATVTRAVYWDGSDPFHYTVQIPAGSYAAPTFTLVAAYACMPGAPLAPVALATGTAASGLDTRNGATTTAPAITAMSTNPCR